MHISLNYFVFRMSLALRAKALIVSAPFVWNSLPLTVAWFSSPAHSNEAC